MIRIALSASYRLSKDEHWEGSGRSQLSQAYVDSFIRAGAAPIIVPVTDNEAVIANILQTVDGVVLTGGEDVDPARYGQERDECTEHVCPLRDAYDALLFQKAQAHGLPVMGICRGMQLINVVMGGTLCQHLDGHIQENPRHETSHEVTVKEESMLVQALGRHSFVNSFHHQAIDRLAAGLHISALSPDGVIEAVESVRGDSPLILAVQWHPEELSGQHDAMNRLFKIFVEYCETRAAL